MLPELPEDRKYQRCRIHRTRNGDAVVDHINVDRFHTFKIVELPLDLNGAVWAVEGYRQDHKHSGRQRRLMLVLARIADGRLRSSGDAGVAVSHCAIFV